MAGVSAGRLSIEIVAEVARLASDLQKVQKLVNSSTNEIARSARAANDNLAAIGSTAGAGVKKFSQDVQVATDYMNRLARSSTDVATRINALTGVSGGIRRSADDIAAYGVEMDRLRAKFNPVFAVTQQYLQTQEEIRRAHAVGAISTEEMTAALSRARQQTLSSIADLKGRTAALREQAAAETEAARQQAAYAAQANALRGQLDPMFAAQQRFNQQLDQAEELYRVGAITAREYAAAQQLARQGLQQHAQAIAGANAASVQHVRQMQQVNAVSGGTRAGMQQLSYQIGDVSQQFALGVSPQIIFAQQSGQVIQAIQLMTGGTSKLAAFLGGPWGIAIASATVVLSPFIGKLFETSDAADTARNALQALIQKQREAAVEATKTIVSEQALNAMRDQRLQLLNRIEKAEELAAKDRNATVRAGRLQGIERLNKELRALNLEIVEGQAAIDIARKAEEDLSKASGDAATATERVTKARTSGARVTGGYAASISDAQRALEREHAEAVRYLETIQRQNEEFGKSEKELREMADARAIDAAGADEQLKAQIRLAAGQREVNIGTDELTKQTEKAAEWRKAQIAPLEKELMLMGLIGPEREKAALALEEEAFKAEALKNHVTDVNAAWEDYYNHRLAIINGESALQKDLEAAQALNEQMDALIGTLGRMGGIGRLFGDVGHVLTSGNPIASLMGLGGVGTLLGSALGGADMTKRMGEEFSQSLQRTFGVKGELADQIGGTLGGVLQGFGIGGAIGGVAKSLGFGGSTATGAGIGGGLAAGVGALASSGALGFGGAQAFLSTLGGPVGIIAGTLLGGVLGNVLGGVLNPNRTASAHVSGSGFTTQGKDTGNYGAASDLASALQDGLGRIADAFGAEIGDFLVSIGVRGDQIRVNTADNGVTSLKFKNGAVGFGQDSEAALKFAIQNAISDGVFEGLSAGVERLLSGEGDLETQLQKALSFQGVFTELERMKDPTGFALGELDKWRAAMDDIFTEAGATAEEVAKLEELYGLKRIEIMEQVGQSVEDAAERERAIRDKNIELLVAQGKVEEATAAARQAQLDDMPEYLRAIQQQINTANDAATAQAKLAEAQEAAARAADERQRTLAGLQAEYLDLTGDTLGAMRLRFEQSIKDITDPDILNAMRVNFGLEYAQAQNRANEAAQQATRAANDNAIAVGALASVTNELAAANDNLDSGIQATIDSLRGFSDELRRFRDGLFVTEFGQERGFGALRAQYNQTAMLARQGDEAALGGLPEIARQFLDMARSRSSTQLQYEDIASRVVEDVNAAIDTSDRRADELEIQRGMYDELRGMRAELNELRNEQRASNQEIIRLNRSQDNTWKDATRGGSSIWTEAA